MRSEAHVSVKGRNVSAPSLDCRAEYLLLASTAPLTRALFQLHVSPAPCR